MPELRAYSVPTSRYAVHPGGMPYSMSLTTAGVGVVPSSASRGFLLLRLIEHRPEHANSRGTDPSLLEWLARKYRSLA